MPNHSGIGGLIGISALNDWDGNNILSPSIGGRAVGIGGDHTTVAGGSAGPVFAGEQGSGSEASGNATHGSLLSLSLLNDWDGNNILSPSIGGLAVGIGSGHMTVVGGSAGSVVAGGQGSGSEAFGNAAHGSLLSVALLNDWDGNNILSPAIGGAALGISSLFGEGELSILGLLDDLLHHG